MPFSSALAASPTPTNSTASEDLVNQIDQLKDKVASRVAELKLVEKRGIIGTVTEVNDTQITVEDTKGDVRFIDVDELTKFDSPDKDSFGISDVKKGMELGILGLYNKESRRLLARFIDVLDLPKVYIGVVSSTDESSFTFNLINSEGKEFAVDVENVTRTFDYDSDGTLSKSGFSKIEKNQNVIVVGFLDAKDPTKISASRVVAFPGVPKNPNILLKEGPLPSAATPTASKKPSPTP